MANGLLDPNNPFQSPVETQGVQPTADGLLGRPAQPPSDMGRMQQLYGLLAQYANDPTQVGLAAARAMQQQRQFEQQQSPAARLERSIGPLTPGHYTEQSLQDYWGELQRTGERRYDLLDRHEALTDRETGMIDDAMKAGYKAETTMNRASRLAGAFMERAKRGELAGWLSEGKRFLARALGREGEEEVLFRELEQLRTADAIANLPTGSASDADVQMALRPMPPVTANPTLIVSWLNGKIKQASILREYEAFRSNYLSRNRTMAGFPEAWDAARDAVTMRAIERAGGLYAPMDRQGNLLNPEEAAMRKYGQMLAQQLPQIMPGQGTATGVAGPTVRTTTPEMSDAEIDAMYGVD